jgi:Flp pilus assembly protein TadD
VGLLRKQGDLGEAIAALRRVADADRGDANARRRLAELLREQGNFDEAVAVLRRSADAGDGEAGR